MNGFCEYRPSGNFILQLNKNTVRRGIKHPLKPVRSRGGYHGGVIPDRREPYRRVPLGRVHLDERRLDDVQ